MPRYRLAIAYDGTDFHGWQRQYIGAAASGDSDPMGAMPTALGEHAPLSSPSPPPSSSEDPRPERRTVQSVVQRAIRESVREPINLIGASRTDSGVHARCQTATFATTGERRGPPDDRLILAINSALPEDVLITSCVLTREDFDPIRDCLAKGYRYSLHVARDRPLWDRRFVHHVWTALDHEAMQAAAAHVVGTHDFAAFAAAGHGRETTIRTVLACRVSRPTPERILIDIAGTGFLWNMVRIVAGTLVEAGRGRIAPDAIPDILTSRDRTRAGPTLPPTGLCLQWGLYPGDDAPALARAHGFDERLFSAPQLNPDRQNTNNTA